MRTSPLTISNAEIAELREEEHRYLERVDNAERRAAQLGAVMGWKDIDD